MMLKYSQHLTYKVNPDSSYSRTNFITIYNKIIIGREFRAIFISTSEATSKDGESINQTKSMSDRYIFNTAITRSQSLVVVVGNPFLLLKMEKHMLQKYGEGAECWTPYIKQCIECKTFTYSERLRKSLKVYSDFKVLLERIYSESSKIGSTEKSKGLDSIIKAYKKVFEDMPEYQVTLMSTPEAHLSWNLKEANHKNEDEENSQDNIAYTDSYECILEVESIHEAKAIPMDGSKRIVKIQGIGNRKGAFDGDQVTVGVFPDNPQDKCYGRILTAKRDSEVQLLCRVSHANPIIFYPIDNKNPMMINLPRISRNLIQRKKIMNIRYMIDSGLKCTDVIVFDRKSLNLDSNDISLPQIRQVIPLSVARNMVFLVSLVRWKKKYRTPLGIVVGAYPKGYTHFNAERLLKLQYAVDYNEDKPRSEVNAKDAERDRNSKLYDQAFTIDPKEAQNLDDALSLVRISTDEDQLKKYELGVHIVNAAGAYLNKKVGNASKFEQEIKRVKLAFSLMSSSEVYSCFICQSLKGTVELAFPQFELKQFPMRARRLRINDFIPEKAADDSQLYSWNLQITSLSRDLAASILESSPLSVVSDSNDSSSSNISMKAFCLNSSDSTLDTEYFKASQQSLVVELSPNNWAKALQFVRNPTKEGMDNIKKLLPAVPPLPSSCSADLINQQKTYSFLDCNIEVSLEPSSVLKVWLTWSMRESLISPAIQLVELSPLLRICVQHNSHPAECFSDPNLKQASKAVYASIEEYIDLWKAVLLAEAAEKSVKECQPMIICDVHLQWPKLVIPKECVEEPYYVPSDDMKIVFPKSFKDQCYEFFKVNIGTLVCVRYGCDPQCPVRAVFHFVVHRIDNRDDDDKEMSISMKYIGEMNCRISEDVKKMLESNRFTCEIQIILMSHSHM